MGSTEDAAVFDMGPFLAAAPGEPPSDETLATCKAMADYIHRTGILVIKVRGRAVKMIVVLADCSGVRQDPRASNADNNNFIDLMQRYYSQPLDALLEDARPDIFYQVGVVSECVVPDSKPGHH
eukprot:SAG31_NODE_6701_length_1919_cov_1.388462_3_plen_124_part_00